MDRCDSSHIQLRGHIIAAIKQAAWALRRMYRQKSHQMIKLLGVLFAKIDGDKLLKTFAQTQQSAINLPLKNA